MAKNPKRLCVQCDKELVGKQARFCSTRCHSAYWNEVRHRGMSKQTISPDEEIQAFFDAFWRLMQDHYLGIEKILKERKR